MSLELDRVVFFGRSWGESLSMYALEPDELEGKRVLDCPGGPGGLVAGAIERGIDMIAVDPRYSETPEALEQQGRDDIAMTLDMARRDPALQMDDADYATYEQEKKMALASFMRAYHRHRNRFVVGSLPSLPFEDGTFDLVLSGHLLFVYAPLSFGGIMTNDSLDLSFHIAAARELMRVGNEVRIFPTYAFTGKVRRQPWVEPVMDVLREDGHKVSFLASRWEQQGHVEFNESLRVIRTR